VDWLQAYRVPRSVGAALVRAVLVGSLSWIAFSLSDDATAVIEKLPEAARKLRKELSAARAVAAQTPEPTWLRDYTLAQYALLATVAAQSPIVLLLTYFLLASGLHFRRKLVQLVGRSPSRNKDAVRILEEIDVQVQRFLLATLASNALPAVATWLAFLALGSGVAAFLQFGSLLHALAAAGVWGLLLGAPLVAIAKVVFDRVESLQPVGELLGR